jgi:hypothetical protein
VWNILQTRWEAGMLLTWMRCSMLQHFLNVTQIKLQTVTYLNDSLIMRIASDTERMRNTPIHVCVNTAIVDWPSSESTRISYFHKLLTLNHYFRKYFKLLWTKNTIMATLTTGIRFLLFTSMHFWASAILRRWSVRSLATDEVARDCRKFETQWSIAVVFNRGYAKTP